MKKITKYSLIVFLLLQNLTSFAQGDDDGGGGLEGGDPAAAPINSILVLLVITAVLFGVYKFRTNKKRA